MATWFLSLDLNFMTGYVGVEAGKLPFGISCVFRSSHNYKIGVR